MLVKIDLVDWMINTYDSDVRVITHQAITEMYCKMALLLPHLMLCNLDFKNNPKVVVPKGDKAFNSTFQCLGRDVVP